MVVVRILLGGARLLAGSVVPGNYALSCVVRDALCKCLPKFAHLDRRLISAVVTAY